MTGRPAYAAFMLLALAVFLAARRCVPQPAALAKPAAVFLHACLTRRIVPPALKYAATFWDLALLTLLIGVGGNGPHSPLMVLYFVVVAAAPLRLSLPLVWAATLGAMAAAAVLLGYYVYFQLGHFAYYNPATGLRVPRVTEGIFLLALGATGLLGGQAVRQARRLVAGYPVRVADAKEVR